MSQTPYYALNDRASSNTGEGYTPEECVKLICRADEIENNETQTTLYWTAITNGHDSHGNVITYKKIEGVETVHTTANTTSVDIIKTASYTYLGVTESCNYIHKGLPYNVSCIYDVESTDSFQVIHNSVISQVLKVWVDDVEMSPMTSISFNVMGEHTIKIAFKDSVNPTKLSDKIPSGAFSNCNFDRVEISSYTKELGRTCFNSQKLTRLDIPSSVIRMDEGVCFNCSNLSVINFQGSLEDWCSITFSNSGNGISTNPYKLFIKNNTLTNLVIPNTINQIKDCTFQRAANIRRVSMPNTITNIGIGAFMDCQGITSITIGSNVETLGMDCFRGCTGLTTLNIPDRVKYIYKGALRNCSNLTTLELGTGLLEINKGNGGYGSFDGCVRLSTIKAYGKTAASINGSGAFNSVGTSAVGTKKLVVIDGSAGYDQSFWSLELCTMLSFVLTIVPCVLNVYYVEDESLECPILGNSIQLSSVESIIVTEIGRQPKRITPTKTYKFSQHSLGTLDSENNVYRVVFKECTKIPQSAFYNCNITSGASTNSLWKTIISSGITEVGNSAYWKCKGLVYVTLPHSITKLGATAFSDCSSLMNVVLPPSLVEIGTNCFYDDDFLTEVNIPASVEIIGDDAFNVCDSLTTITVDSNNQYYSAVDNILFDKNKTTLIRCPGAYSGSYTIPNTVTSISKRAFAGCDSLTSIVIPNTITRIREYTFTECTELSSITFSNTLTSIGSFAFYKCTNLNNIVLPSTITTLEQSAFNSCGISSIVLPESLTSVGLLCFSNCTSLTQISFNSISCSFGGSGSTTSFSGSVFLGCPISGITFGSQVRRIPEGILYGQIGVTSLTLPSTVTVIAGYAFSGCRNIASTLIIPNSVTSIGSNAFYNCSGMTITTLPTSLTSLGSYALAYCSLSNLSIPSTAITSIGDNAFYSSTIVNLTMARTTPPTLGSNAFYQCTHLAHIYVPIGSGPAYSNANNWGTYENYITENS